MSKVLIVIDVQNHFAVEKAADLPQKIAEYVKKSNYEQVVFTKFRNVPDSNFHKILHYTRVMSPPETDIHPALSKLADQHTTFEKITYSAFKGPGFKEFLDKAQATELDICGINIDGCVLATAYEAFDLGYKVKILEDLSSVASFRDDYEVSAKIIITRNLKRKKPK